MSDIDQSRDSFRNSRCHEGWQLIAFFFGTDWSSHKYKWTYHIVLLHQKKNCKWFFHLVWLFFAGEIITATFIGSEIITHKFRRWLYHTRWNNSCEKHLVWFFVWKKSRVILVCHTRWKGEIITRDKWLSCELRFFFVCHTRWKKSRLTRESFISCELRIFFISWYFFQVVIFFVISCDLNSQESH